MSSAAITATDHTTFSASLQARVLTSWRDGSSPAPVRLSAFISITIRRSVPIRRMVERASPKSTADAEDYGVVGVSETAGRLGRSGRMRMRRRGDGGVEDAAHLHRELIAGERLLQERDA